MKGSAATPCYPEKLSSGNAFLSEFTAAPGYRGWTDTCPAEQSECTEFRDPNDHSDLAHPKGKPYFFINNDKLDKTTCGGRVDLLSGCVLFRDMNESRLLYSTAATYAKAAKEDHDAQSPINCHIDTDNPFCANTKSCTGVIVKGACPVLEGPCTLASADELATAVKKTNAACTTNADCGDGDRVIGTCTAKNDSNLIVKVKLDRDCASWLGCSSGETVYDASQGKYVDLCTNVAVCDKAIGAQGKDFCAHYADRKFEVPPKPLPRDSFYETVLREGNFINANSYITRQIGLGKPDYSGYTLPNHFQVADFQSRRVAYELLTNVSGSVRDRYVNDYRLVAAAPLREDFADVSKKIWASFPSEGGLTLLAKKQKSILVETFPPHFAQRYLDLKSPRLNLCQHAQTGQIGYFVGSADHIPTEPLQCYFAIDTPYTQNPADLAPGGGGINSRNAQDLAVLLNNLMTLRRTSRFHRHFASRMQGVSRRLISFDVICERVDLRTIRRNRDRLLPDMKTRRCANLARIAHAITERFRMVARQSISPFGSPALIGICVGADAPAKHAAGRGHCRENSNVDLLANPERKSRAGLSGTCESIQSVSYIRGQFGQCLERDATRTVAGAQDKNPCLVWNPTPLLFGQNDIYHYQPTAAIFRQHRANTIAISRRAAFTANGVAGCRLKPPGTMECHKFHFYDEAVSDGECLGCGGDDAWFLDGVKPKGGAMGELCEDADDDQIARKQLGCFASRWIMTGRGKVEITEIFHRDESERGRAT